jgi:hypothetical protein
MTAVVSDINMSISKMQDSQGFVTQGRFSIDS